MGFYGKVTNSSKTQFSFDRIYANRKEMDALCASDGVFVGRYVLIDYDEGNASFKRIYVKELDNGKKVAWATANLDEAIGELKKGNFTDGETVYEAQLLGANETQVIKKYYTVKFVGDSYELVDAEEPAESIVSNYVTNFNIDKEYVTDKANGDERAFGRGYDSTVWTKVFEKGQYKYVSVAELNSVVPTFDIAADAPTLSPITPHFDADSTNVYYKLHAQPTWGFRIKKATPELIYDVDPVTGEIGSEPVENPSDSDLKDLMVEHKKDYNLYRLNSDQNTVWKRKEYNKYPEKDGEENPLYIRDYYYNPHTDRWEEYKNEDEVDINGQLSADIYYNKDGFSKDYIYKSNPDLKDEITITPSGKSGHIYAHEDSPAEDIQELSIHLGSIGDTISDMWDMVYGDASSNRYHEGNWEKVVGETPDGKEIKRLEWNANEEPAVKLVPQKINLTKTELDYYKTRSELIGSKGILKWVNKGFKPTEINESGVYDVGRNTTWSEDKEFYIFNKTPFRNTDIKWRDGLDTISNEPDYESYMGYEAYPPTQSMRLVHAENDQTNGKEYTYNKDQVSTIAGTINAAHDLMGMIIHEVTDKESITDEYVDNSEENLIYYYPRYYGEGDTKVHNEVIHLGCDENGVPNRGIILKEQEITKNNFEAVSVPSSDSFLPGEMYLFNKDDEPYLAKYDPAIQTYYKLNTVDLPEELQTLRKDYLVEPGQFYRKKVDYIYEEVPEARYWSKNDKENAGWEKAGDHGKLIQFNKDHLFTREIKHYLDSKGNADSYYRYIPTNDEEALLGKSYYELITDNGSKILELDSLKAEDLHFYSPYNLERNTGYWTNRKDDKGINTEGKKIYVQERAKTRTEAVNISEKDFYQFTPNVLADKELYIPGTYVLKLERKSRNPKLDDMILTVPTAAFALTEAQGGGQKCVQLNQLAKSTYTIGIDNSILEILFKYNSSYYTSNTDYEDVYTNLGLFPIDWSNPTEKEIDLGGGIKQKIQTYDINDRFEGKTASNFYSLDPENPGEMYYEAGFTKCRYSIFTLDNLNSIDTTSKLHDALRKIKEVWTINNDGIISEVRKTIPESLIDRYIGEDATAKEDAQKLLEEFSTKKYFFSGPGEYIFKFEELKREEDEKFNALNLKRINGLQKVITINLDGGEGPAVEYEDIPEEDLKEILGLTLDQLLNGKKPVNAFASQLGQEMSNINKRINAIVDLYDNGKNSNEINNYEFDFKNPNLYYIYDLLFNKPLAGQGYYAERLKYINLPESEYTENFYNLMAETGNLFVLNEPEDPEAELEDGEERPKDLIEPIEISKYAANAFFVRRTKTFENPLDPTKPLIKVYWNLASEVTPKADENYYDLSDYLIPVEIGEEFDNKKDYYIKAKMPVTEEYAWDDIEYYKINSVSGPYQPSEMSVILSDGKGHETPYPDPNKINKVFVIANVGTSLLMYEPDKYYRRRNSGEYELDITESGKEPIYSESDYYIWPKDGSSDKNYLKTSDKFFIPNVYYYDREGIIWPTEWDTAYDSPYYNNGDDKTVYYKGRTYYVIKDDLGHYTPGAEWNPAVIPVPKSVHLGIRKEMSKWEKLEDFSRTYNTLNGLILRTNKLLEDGDKYTRDTSTIQGCINRIRDIIAKFEATIPGNLMVVDGYGRIRGSDYITKQPDRITNYGKIVNDDFAEVIIPEDKKEYLNHVDENGERHGRWIDLQVFNYFFNGKGYNNWEAVEKEVGKLSFVGDPNNTKPNVSKYQYYYTWSKLDEAAFNKDKKSFYIVDKDAKTIVKNGDAAYDPSKEYYKLIEFENDEDNFVKYEQNDRLEITDHHAHELTHYVIMSNTEIKLVHNFIHPEARPDNTLTNSNLNLDIPIYDETAINTPGDDIILYSPIVDDMGHIVAHNEEMVTLPYGFKYLEAKNNVTEDGLDSDIYSNSVTNMENQNVVDTKDKDSDKSTYTRAKNTQDTLLFEAKNKWLQVQLTPKDLDDHREMSIGGNTKDTLTIAHEIHSIDRTSKSTDNNVADGITPNDTITVQDLEFDNAGHVTENHKHTYTLPYSYKHITTSHSGSVNSITQNTNTTTADNTQDKVEFAMGNKWLESKVENDKVTFAHETHWTAANDATDKDTLSGFNRNTKTSRTTSDLNGLETFTTEHYTFDNAGHVNSHNTHTYEMPHGYSFLLTKGTSTSTDFVTGNDSALGAMKTKDNVEFVAGNRWLTISGSDSNADGVNDTITFRHAPAGTAVTLKGDSDNQTPDYGATFKVPYVTIDEAGHVKTLTDHTVTMPKQSIGGVGNVVTKVDHDTGNTLTFTHEQLMNLKLSTSSTVETLAVTKSASPDQHTSHTAITSANTLREAFGAIPTMIDERVEDILGTATPDTLDTLTEISAWINANGADLNKYVNLVTLEKDFYGLDSNGNVLSYNGTSSLMNRTSTLETAKNNIYTMLGDVDHYALNGHYSLDHSAVRDPNKVYYTFSNGQYVEILLTDSMYEPSKYYIKDITVEERIKGLESQVDHYVTDDLKQKVDAAWDLLQTVQQTTGNVPADPDTMTPTASVDGYMKYHVGRTAPTDTEGNPITNAMWIDTTNMQNILVKFPVYNYDAATGKNVLSWIAINTWQ